MQREALEMLYPDALVNLANANGALSEKSGQAATFGESYGGAENE